MMVNWLKNAVFYEIYPQSFADTNGDGLEISRGSSTIWIIFRSWAAMPSG